VEQMAQLVVVVVQEVEQVMVAVQVLELVIHLLQVHLKEIMVELQLVT